MKVVHLTSVHARFDTRIFVKQCTSLRNAGYETHIVVADGKGDEEKCGIMIHDVGTFSGRFQRMRQAPQRVLRKALSLGGALYHFHDPELIPIGLRLEAAGKKVIWDVHEDVPKQLMGKPYLGKGARWSLSKSFGVYEKLVCKRFDAIIAATPSICQKFHAYGAQTININNFPILGELSFAEDSVAEKGKKVCYVGGVSSIRGIFQLLDAMMIVESGARLQLVGSFSEFETEVGARNAQGWAHVDALGTLGRRDVAKVLHRSVAGLVTFLPAPNHFDAQPNKLFEYMSAGIPVIASHFPLWREIVEGHRCGVCVDPVDPHAIARAIDYLINHPEEAEEMGRNGQQAVQEMYNWQIEERKLLKLYEGLA